MNALDRNQNAVSIVLPVYNGARFLRQSIESCLSQTYQNIELVIVDDGSKDGSIDIVKSYGDDRIKLVCHGVNKKLPAALNTGFKHASGVYLTWTSHDNYYVSTAIAEMVSVLEQYPEVAFVFADHYDVDESGGVLRHIKNGPVEKLWELNCIGAAFLYRRAVYEKLGPYDQRAFFAEDYEYWLRASRCFKLAHLDRPLTHYRRHSESLTSQFCQNGEAIEAALAMKRRILGSEPWRNRLLLHRLHLRDAFYLRKRKCRTAAIRAALWAIAFKPECLIRRDVRLLLAELLLTSRGFEFLQQVRRGALRLRVRNMGLTKDKE